MAYPRLPVPGHDDGAWGEILNEFLLVAHNQDGSLKGALTSGDGVDAQYVADAIQAKVDTTDPRLSDSRTPIDGSVATAKLQDDSVTEQKLAISNAPSPGMILAWSGSSLLWVSPVVAPVQSVNGRQGAVSLDASDVGLGSVDNTSDADKPLSTATQDALNEKAAIDDLSLVATTGSYADLINRPTIPIPGTTAGTYTAGNDTRVTGALQRSIATTKGDIFAATDDSNIARVGVGSNGQVLQADSSQPAGVRWATPQVAATGITRVVSVLIEDMTAGSAANTDYVYIIADAYTLTMPDATSNSNRYTVKNRHSSSVDLAFTNSQTADGGGILLPPGNSVDLVSDGNNWVII